MFDYVSSVDFLVICISYIIILSNQTLFLCLSIHALIPFIKPLQSTIAFSHYNNQLCFDMPFTFFLAYISVLSPIRILQLMHFLHFTNKFFSTQYQVIYSFEWWMLFPGHSMSGSINSRFKNLKFNWNNWIREFWNLITGSVDF